MNELLSTLNLEQYREVFEEEGIDDLDTLREYSEEELLEIGLKRGHVKKLLKALCEASENENAASVPQTTPEWYHALCEDETLWHKWLLESDIAIFTHEYTRIKSLLCKGQYFGVLLQIKDFFEIVLKFPVLIVINELYNKPVHSDGEEAFLLLALQQPLSLGHWHQLATAIKKNGFAENEDFDRLISAVLKLYNKNDIIKWRNDEIGHGALSLESDSAFQEDIKTKLLLIRKFLDAEAERLMNIVVDIEGMSISYKDTTHSFLPFFSLIDNQVYFFDSYLSKKRKTHQIDYCMGKKVVSTVPDFARFISKSERMRRENGLSCAAVDEVRIAEEEQQFDSLEAGSDFIKPEHLLAWLKRSMTENTRGKMLLQMQRGTGKSLFCKALDQLSLHKMELDDDTLVRAYYINDVFRNSLGDFTSEIGHFVLNKKRSSGHFTDVFKGNLPRLSTESTPNDFAYMLNWYKQHYDVQSLLLIIDGVDEIPAGEEKSIFDILPDTKLLDEGVHILVTARTDEEITHYTKSHIAALDFVDTKVLYKDSDENLSLLKEYINSSRIALSDEQVQMLIEKSDYRILYLTMLKEIILSTNIDIDTLPSSEEIIDYYLENIKAKYGEKYFTGIFRLLIVLASEFEELSLEEVALLNNDATVSLKLLANLFDLRGFLKITRNEQGNLFSLNHISLVIYFNERYREEIREYLYEAYQDLEQFSPIDKADIYKLAYLEAYEKKYRMELFPKVSSRTLLPFLLALDTDKHHRVANIAALLLTLYVQEGCIESALKGLAQLPKEVVEKGIGRKISDPDFVHFIKANVAGIIEAYVPSHYDVVRLLYVYLYKYDDKNTAFELLDLLLREDEKFEDILNYISMCKGDSKLPEAQRTVEKYLEENHFNPLQRAYFYYIVGRMYVDHVSDYVKSREYLMNAIAIFEEHGEHVNANIVKNTLSMYYFSNQEYAKAEALLFPIYREMMADQTNAYDQNARESIYCNMFIYTYVVHKTLLEDEMHFLNKEIEVYCLNYRAIASVAAKAYEQARKLFDEAIEVSGEHQRLFANTVSKYNKSLLFDKDAQLFNEAMSVVCEKGYTAGENIMRNSHSSAKITRAYPIEGNNYWICLKNIDLLI